MASRKHRDGEGDVRDAEQLKKDILGESATSDGVKDPVERRRRFLAHDGINYLWKALLTFEWAPHADYWQAAPQTPFKPRGLVIWGAPPGATIHFQTGNRQEITISFPEAPCKFFSMGENFAQLQKLIDEGKDIPNWVDWSAMAPGILVRATIYTIDRKKLCPADGVELVMWGESKIYGYP